MPEGFFLFFFLVFLPLGRIYTLREFREDVFEDDGIQIAAQHIDDPPISNIDFFGDGLCHLSGYHAIACIEDSGTNCWHRYNHSPRDEMRT